MNLTANRLRSWYSSVVRSDTDGFYCDHLAVCLLLELCAIGQIENNGSPILTSFDELALALKAPAYEIKHSLELLHELGLISISYPHEPELLLAGAIYIYLSEREISYLSDKTPTIDRSGYIYVIRFGQSNFYKIGRTNNLKKRISTLQTACALPLEVVKTFFCHDVVAIEKATHAKFAHFRAKGEWFSLDFKQLNRILNWLEVCRH